MLSPSTLVARNAPLPRHAGPAVPCYSPLPSSPLRAMKAASEKVPHHRLLQPTFDTSTRKNRRIPALGAPFSASVRVEARLTPSFQLRAGSATLSSRLGRRGASYRTTLPGRRLVRPLAGLAARPLTPPVTIRRHRQRRSPRTVRIAFPGPSSKSPASTTQSAFHRQVLPRGALARFLGGAVAVLTVLPPRAGFRSPLNRPRLSSGAARTRCIARPSPHDATR
jgi:hypothetical protein